MRSTLQLVVAALLLLPTGASAALIGEDAELSYFFPDQDTLFTGPGYEPQQFIVGPGTEVGFFGNAQNPNMSLDVTADELRFLVTDDACCATVADFNGPVVEFTSGTFPGIASATILSTDLPLSDADLLVEPTRVGIDWNGVDVRSSHITLGIVLVPEPTSFLLVATGLSLLGLRRRPTRCCG